MELNELPDELINIRQKTTYTTPVNYFTELPQEIMSKINLPLATGLPFSAPPAHYFDTLPDYILLKIKNTNQISFSNEVQNELEELEPSLARISKANVYRVPQNYFDSFTVSIPVVKRPATIKMKQRPTSWFNYVAAAIIVAIIGFSIIFFVKQRAGNEDATNNYAQVLARVPDNELSDYLMKTSHDADLLPAFQDENNGADPDNLFKTLLNNVSDNELQDYLNKNDDGDEKDIKGI